MQSRLPSARVPKAPTLRLLALLLLGWATGLGCQIQSASERDGEPAPPRSVVARWADAPVEDPIRQAVARIQRERGPVIATLRLGDSRALSDWDVSVGGGQLIALPEEGCARVRTGPEPLTWLRVRPPVPLPPSFRAEIRVKDRAGGGQLPTRLLWESEQLSDFSPWRHAPAKGLGPNAEGTKGAAFEVLQWSGEIERVRFDFMSPGEDVDVTEIVFYAPPARNVTIAEDGTLWGVLDARAQPAIWAPLPSTRTLRQRVPDDALLRVSLGGATSPRSTRVRFRVWVAGEPTPRLEALREACAGCTRWLPVEVDLGDLAGREVELRLEAEVVAGAEDGIALWGSPMLLGRTAEVPPVVVLVTWDTARHSQLSLYGNAAANTPFANELAASGALFERAFSQAPWTAPSMASLLTSRAPWELGIAWGESHRIPERATTLAEVFAKQGFVTAGFVANFVLALDAGFPQGFDVYDVSSDQMADGKKITDAALAWARRHQGEPLFLFVHYVDPHAPYRPDRAAHDRLFPTLDFERHRSARYPPQDAESAEILLRRYEVEILRSDRELRRLLETLRQTLGREPIVALTSDHGEEFLEHGFYGHGTNVFATQTQVPLLFSGPGVPTARIASPVRNLDVMPTLLELAGVEAPGPMAGSSLVPLMRGEPLPLVAYSETNSHGARRAAVRDDRFSYLTFETHDPLSRHRSGTDPMIEGQLTTLPARALYDADTGAELDLSAYPVEVQRLQAVIDDIELRRHEGIGVRLRGPRQGNQSVEIRGRVRLAGGTIASARTRLAEGGQDRFEISQDRSALSFVARLAPGEEDWILVTPSQPGVQATLELDAQTTDALVALVGTTRVQAKAPIAIAIASPDTTSEALQQAIDDAGPQPIAQVWQTRRIDQAQEPPEPTAEEISRLRALGYMK